MRIKLQTQDNAESRPQWRGKQSCPCRSADEGEGFHVHGMRSRCRALSNDDVQLVILQRGVKDLLQRRLQPVNFINKQDLLVADVGQDGREIALDLQRWARSLLERRRQFVGDDGCKSSFAQSGWTIKQNMVERLAARARCLNRHCQIFFDFWLSNELRESLWPQL